MIIVTSQSATCNRHYQSSIIGLLFLCAAYQSDYMNHPTSLTPDWDIGKISNNDKSNSKIFAVVSSEKEENKKQYSEWKKNKIIEDSTKNWLNIFLEH
jgi:hypothetical protein